MLDWSSVPHPSHPSTPMRHCLLPEQTPHPPPHAAVCDPFTEILQAAHAPLFVPTGCPQPTSAQQHMPLCLSPPGAPSPHRPSSLDETTTPGLHPYNLPSPPPPPLLFPHHIGSPTHPSLFPYNPLLFPHPRYFSRTTHCFSHTPVTSPAGWCTRCNRSLHRSPAQRTTPTR